MPVFKRMEREFGGADFYKVNFKAETELCYNERVFSFPTVHFYLPGIGRVGRCVLTAKEAEPRLRGGLARFLGGSEGAPRQLLLLQELRTEVLRYLPPSHRAQPVPQAVDPRPRTLCPRP